MSTHIMIFSLLADWLKLFSVFTLLQIYRFVPTNKKRLRKNQYKGKKKENCKRYNLESSSVHVYSYNYKSNLHRDLSIQKIYQVFIK